MRAALIKDSKVVNIAKFADDVDLPMGWVASDDASIKDAYSGDGTFSRPAKLAPEPPTIIEQIVKLETSITRRNLRGAILGDAFSIDKIQSIENQIALLRTEL